MKVFPNHKLQARDIHYDVTCDKSNGSYSKASHHTDDMLESPSEPQHGTVIRHVKKASNECIGNDRSSHRGSELSHIAFLDYDGHGTLDSIIGPDVS